MTFLPTLLLPTSEALEVKLNLALREIMDARAGVHAKRAYYLKHGEPVAIYCWFDAQGVRYVGLTADPTKREKTHMLGSAPYSKQLTASNCKFRVLRWTTNSNGDRLEAQITRAYKRRGQADLNGRIGGGRGANWGGYRILWIEGEITFESGAQCARYFGISGGTVTNAFKFHGGKLMDGQTLKML